MTSAAASSARSNQAAHAADSLAAPTSVQVDNRRLTDQHRPLTVYTFHCGRCEKELGAEFGPLWYSGEHKIEDYDDLEDSNWEQVAGKWVCPDCWHWCEKADDGSEKGLGPQEGCCDGL